MQGKNVINIVIVRVANVYGVGRRDYVVGKVGKKKSVIVTWEVTPCIFVSCRNLIGSLKLLNMA